MMNNMVKKDLTQDIGSRMSGNFVCIRDTLTIREAMSELVRQAGVHDNIATLYVVDAGRCVRRRHRPEGSHHCTGKRSIGGHHPPRLSLRFRQ